MQQIERYGVIALVFLLVTIVAVSFWGDSKSPGFWSRLTGRGGKKDAVASRTVDPVPPAGAAGERAIQGELPLSPAASSTSPLVPLDPAPSSGAAPAPAGWAATSPAPAPVVSAPTLDPAPPVRSAPLADRSIGTGGTGGAAVSGGTAEAAEYVVEKGDSMIGIASRLLGDKGRWTEIRDLNRGIDPRHLSVGMKLAIPASAPAAKSTAPSKLQPPVRRSATAPDSKSSKNTGGTYLVRKGDTLKSIAERLLGNSRRWREIAASNPGLDPQHIHVGAKLRMPGGKTDPVVAAASIPVRASSSDRPRVR